MRAFGVEFPAFAMALNGAMLNELSEMEAFQSLKSMRPS